MASMHFWGVEVNGKQPTPVTLEEGQVIHISQATLGELKKDKEPVIIHLSVGGKKLVMGVLSQNTPQLSFDLVLDQDFEISHNWKNGTVHFLGYDSDMPEEDYSDFSEDEDDVPAAVPIKENGKAGVSAAAKAPADNGKKAKPDPKAEKDDEDDSDDDDDSEDDDDDSDEEMAKFGDSDDDSSDEEDSDDDEDSDEEETPKPESPKKRSKPVVKTPEPKKAKLSTPQKTDGKKGGAPHTATPHPSKKAGKSGGDKPSPKSKSGGKLSCGSCSKTFNNEVGLQSHTKAKHGK